MFLTSDDIKDLTGYKTHAKQIGWLMQNGIKFLISQDGKPRVLVSHLQEIMGSTKQVKRRTEPNEKALMKHMGLI